MADDFDQGGSSEEYTRHQELRESEIQTNKDMDSQLKAIWQKDNSPQAKEREFMADPPMPKASAELSELESLKQVHDWVNMPLSERRLLANADRNFDAMKEAAATYGIEVKTAADIEAFRKMVNGEAGTNAKPAQIDPEIQSSLDTFQKIVPSAKSHSEAASFLNGLAAEVARDPFNGTRKVVSSLGANPVQLLTPQERHQVFNEELQQRGYAPPESAREAHIVEAWIADRGLSMEDRIAMAEVIQSPAWKDIPNESELRTLERARKMVARSRSQRAPHKGSEAALDSQLQQMARKAYGE